MIEMLVTVAIVAVVAGLAWSSYAAARPRLRLTNTSAEVESLISMARQKALGSGRDVSVLFYPTQGTGAGVGRIVVFYDGEGGFMAGTPPAGFPSFCDYDSEKMPEGGRNSTVAFIDVPPSVRIAAAPANLVPIPFPYATVPFPATGCSFCDGGNTRGGIRFDSRGRAWFYSTCGPPGPSATGGSITISSDRILGTYVVVVTPTGSVRTFNAG